MKIRVLGCHGSQLLHHRTTSFLLDQNILVDAGTVTPVLTLPQQMRIDYILVTHAHLDHVRDIMFLADNLYYAGRKKPLVVLSSRGIIDSIHRHLINNVIWPDFTRIPIGARRSSDLGFVAPAGKKR
jgi:cAMP phosphodiesterase